MRNRILVSVIAAIWGVLSSTAALAIPAQQPLFLVSPVSPMVMIAMSVDHQLFVKAFADYSDLNGDGIIDNGYTDSFDYYGYFDNRRCYAYALAGGYFVPKSTAGGTHGHHCDNNVDDGDWSGNFLNWATMTRIDVLRKALYGGKRAVDTTSQTILERELLPSDTHAFVKVFSAAAGDSIANYLPSAYAGAGTVSLCNVTPAASGQTQNFDTSVYQPKLRIAGGDWRRWAADEAIQCAWHEERVAAGVPTASNPALRSSPAKADNLFGAGTAAAPSVRVETCAAGKLEANCRTYDPTSAAKPIGLLQEYGEDGTLRFGLLSGSYQARDKGGVLRKGISHIAGNANPADDEVNLTDGTLNSNVDGIIATLDRLRINAWNYGIHKYQDCNPYDIGINEYLTSTASDRRCSNWGNPISEIYLEAVRYLIGETAPTSSFTVGADALGLPTAVWDSTTDPMPAAAWCTPMNVVLISSGDNSFDTDDLAGNVPSVLGNVDAATDAIGSAEGLSGEVFIGEVGASPMTDPDSNHCSAKTFTSLSQMRGLCPSTPTKQGGYAVAGLAHKAHTTDLRGDRQNDPATGKGQSINTYAVAMAKDLPDFVFNVGSSPITVVPIAYTRFNGPGSAWKASSLVQVEVEETAYDAAGNLTYARFLAYWEDSAWGNDYDMDVVSRLSICVGAECLQHDDDGDGVNDSDPGAGHLRVTTRAIRAAASAGMRVGFVISGTTADNVYANVLKPDTVTYDSFPVDPLRAAAEPTPVALAFVPGTSTAENLPSPLQLAAKYGTFNDSNGNQLPDVQSEWDGNGDGVADSFFFADDPSQIGPKLAAYLGTIATLSSSASVVANSASLQSSTRIYQARFDSTDWSGSVVSIPIDLATGAVLPVEWDAANMIAGQDWDTGREWLTWDGDTQSGVPFRWSSLNPAQQQWLDSPLASGPGDGFGSDRVEYLRGNSYYETAQGNTAPGTPSFRNRSTPLGDVVNSTPTVVGSPDFGYSDSLESVKYSDFKATYADTACYDLGGNLRPVSALDREPMLYFGANDGALHGVSACTGEERIAYVPGAVYPELSRLTSENYMHRYYVDGPATVVDAFWGGAWHTTLVGTLRAGGKGVFALDVTDPGKFDEAYANQVVLWDIQATPLTAGSDFEELGYTFSQPAVVKAEGHGWVAVFGNGYHGKSGKAVLYIVRLSDGTLLQSIDLSAPGPGAASHGANNGLSTVSPIDRNGDGEVDLIYAGDLNGNLWRFEASSGIGFTRANTTLLYSARSELNVPQPITARMAVGYHPSSAVGRLVYFGTGKYYESVDQDPNTAVRYNTMYGIWDRDNGATISSVTTRDSNTLQQQTIATQTLSTFGSNSETIRVLTDTTVSWAPATGNTCAAGASCGWYLDLTDVGEKMVATPILRGGRLIFVTTTPSAVPCEAGGSGWLMEIDPYTGGQLGIPVFDLNGDGVFDFNDNFASLTGGVPTFTPISGKKSKVGILQPPAIITGIGGKGAGGYGGAEGKYSSGSNDAQIDVTIENPGGMAAGRKSWVRIK